MLNCNFHYQRGEFNLHIQLEMQQQILGVVGASGSGKTTFLKNTTKDMSILEQRYFEVFKTLDIIMPSELNGYIENTRSRNPADGLHIKTKSIRWFQFL